MKRRYSGYLFCGDHSRIEISSVWLGHFEIDQQGTRTLRPAFIIQLEIAPNADSTAYLSSALQSIDIRALIA
jgi:hypothetical protein